MNNLKLLLLLKKLKESSMNIETASTNVGKMDEAVKAGTVTEVLLEGGSGDPEDIYGCRRTLSLFYKC